MLTPDIVTLLTTPGDRDRADDAEATGSSTDDSQARRAALFTAGHPAVTPAVTTPADASTPPCLCRSVLAPPVRRKLAPPTRPPS